MKNYVRIIFLNPSKDQLEHIYKARNELGKAGITFDSNYNVEDNIYNWEFDWSLKGAKTEVRKSK